MSAIRERHTVKSSQNNIQSMQKVQRKDDGLNTVKKFGSSAKKFLVFLCTCYCFGLLCVCLSSSFRHQLVFMNLFFNPFANYNSTEAYGLVNGKNFYIEGNDGHLGVWQIPALGSVTIDDGKPLVLYMHGNAYSRAAGHRIALYNLLSSLGCHVIAHDYRGFGDSEGHPSESGIVDDTLLIFKWILDNTKNSPLYLWGHSLGAAVAVQVSKKLTETDVMINGVILEAPFNNMKDAAINHPLAMPYRFLPFFQDTLQEINEMFRSDELISHTNYNILILHGNADKIVKFQLGRKLYDAATRSRKKNQDIFFEEFHGFNHVNICWSPELSSILRNFMRLREIGDDQQR